MRHGRALAAAAPAVPVPDAIAMRLFASVMCCTHVMCGAQSVVCCKLAKVSNRTQRHDEVIDYETIERKRQRAIGIATAVRRHVATAELLQSNVAGGHWRFDCVDNDARTRCAHHSLLQEQVDRCEVRRLLNWCSVRRR
jgi:hypothetical protein